MIRQRWRLLLALLVASLWGGAARGEGVPLPEKSFPALEEILRHAAQQSPRMIGRALDLEIAENNRVAARAALLPSVSAAYRVYQAQDDRADQSGTLMATKIYYDLAVSQPLFHWGERRNLARIGEIQQELAQGGYREAYRGLAQELRQRYLALVVQKLQVARTRGARELAEQRLKEGEQRFAEQRISPAEWQSIQVGTEHARIGLERIEFDFEAAKSSFARLAGLPGFDEAQIPDDLPKIAHDPAPVERLLAAFLAAPAEAAPEAIALRGQQKIEELNLANNRTRLRPKVNAVAGLTQDEHSYTLNTADRYRVLSLYGGVAVNWTIFDGYAARSATRSSLARLRQLELNNEETLLRLGETAQAQVKHLGFAARFMAIADQGLATAEATLATREDDLRRGVVSANDLTVARLQLLDAKITACNARIDYLMRLGEFLGTVARDPILENFSLPR